MRADLVLAGLLLTVGFTSSAHAGEESVITVNSTLDLPDANPFDGLADADLDTPGVQVTLRSAIMHAHLSPGVERIELPAGLYRLTRKDVPSDDPETVGDLDVSTTVEIVGDGAGVTIIDARRGRDRAFDVASSGELVLSGLTIRGGRPSLGGGGGIRNEGGTLELDDVEITKCRTREKDTDGGGIESNFGTVSLDGCWIHRCRATDDGGGFDNGGGLVSVNDTTFERNRARSEGGGFETDSPGDVSLVNCTFSKNRAKTQGAAVNVENGADLDVTNCTFVLNRSKADSALCGADVGPNTLTLANTIVYGKSKKRPNLSGGVLVDLGGNVDDGDGLGLSHSGSFSGLDPRLDKKARDNGGLGRTHLLLEDSPAIDVGVDGLAPSEDQLGNARVDIPGVGSTTSDAGAVEFSSGVIAD